MYYKLGQACVTNWGSFVLLQIRANVVTNWGSYYKLGQLLLQNRAAITNWCKMYYKLGQVLQIRAIIKNWDIKNPKITLKTIYSTFYLNQTNHPVIYIDAFVMIRLMPQEELC